MNAAELREALGDDKAPVLAGLPPPFDELLARTWIVEQAARTIALPILEADPELVERIAKALQTIRIGFEVSTPPATFDHSNAQLLLAAISTPTPVESE